MFNDDIINIILIGTIGVMIIYVLIYLMKEYNINKRTNANDRINEIDKLTREEKYEWKSRHNTL